MAVISSPDCRWNVCKDCGHFFFKDRYIFLYLSVVRGSVDFGNHFLSDFFSNVCSHSHGCKVMLSALVIGLRNHCY